MQPEVRHAVTAFLRRSRPGKLLDFPAGKGWLLDALTDPAWEYHGADLYTRPELPNFRIANLQQPFPYVDGEFDYVVCLEGLEHIENYHHVLRESHRILRPGGVLLISTPNPLSVKGRLRYFWRGTFNGFPHLVDMPAEGEHVHVSPINLSFLLAFANKYGLEPREVHPLRIKLGSYRFAPFALAIQAHTWLRGLGQPSRTRAWMRRLTTWNVLLNNGVVVSFTRRTAEAEQRPISNAPRSKPKAA